MRGPGKKKNGLKISQPRATPLQPQLQGAKAQNNNNNNNNEIDASNNDVLPADMSGVFDSQAQLALSEEFVDLDTLLFPTILHPTNDLPMLPDLKHAIQEDQKSPGGFVPLISQEKLRQLFETTYSEITTVFPLLDLPTLNRLNAEQHALSSTSPAGNPARWAIINTWVAMGVRFKMAPVSEDIVEAYYRNAVLVLPDLILQPANKEAIQALLFMAMYAECSLDHRSYVMLVTVALRQIEFLAPRLFEVMDRGNVEACRQELSFAQLQDMKVATKYHVTLLLGSLATYLA